MNNGVQHYIESLSQPVVQKFIRANEDQDIYELVLKQKTVDGVPVQLIANQISALKKSRTKLPVLAGTEGIIFPAAINLEQCSSEATARFKTQFLKSKLPESNTIVDLTGGFGIDALAFSSLFQQVISLDPDKDLNSIVRYNLNKLKLSNIERQDSDAESFLKTVGREVSCFYADPSRRVNTRKIAALKECQPDITKLLPLIFEHSRFLLVKASPLLDISQATSELSCVRDVIVLAVENECREVLFLCERGFQEPYVIHAINISRRDSTEFSFTRKDEAEANPGFGEPLLYLYEPNTAILKAGAFKLVANKYRLTKLAKNTHLYTSAELQSDFPGRIFRIDQELKPDSSFVQRIIGDGKANIISRNYPLDVAALRKKLKITDGGSSYIIATSLATRKLMLLANRLK